MLTRKQDWWKWRKCQIITPSPYQYITVIKWQENIINMFIVLLPVVAWTTADHPKPHSKLCLLYSRSFIKISKSYVKFSVTKLHDINHDLEAKFGLGSGSQAVYVVDTVVFTYSFNIADGIWLKYCQCCVKHYPINRLTYLRQFRWKLKIYRQDKRMESCWHFLLRGKEYIEVNHIS